MIIILSLLCGLMTASTHTASLASHSLEEATHNWKPIPTHGLFITDQVFASIINLARAHFVDKQDNFSQPLCETLHTLFITHCQKMRLFHMINDGVARTDKVLKSMNAYASAIIQSTPRKDHSELQQKITSLLEDSIIFNDEPSTKTHDLLPYLKNPDTAPIKKLLTDFLPTVSAPSAQGPLEFLLSLDWDQVFKTFVSSCYVNGLGHTWSHCDISIQYLSSLLHAKTREELLTAEKATSKMYSKVNLQPAASFKAAAINAQV